MKKLMAEDGGWVKETRAKNFIHKREGTGGGHVNIKHSPPKGQQQTH